MTRTGQWTGVRTCGTSQVSDAHGLLLAPARGSLTLRQASYMKYVVSSRWSTCVRRTAYRRSAYGT